MRLCQAVATAVGSCLVIVCGFSAAALAADTLCDPSLSTTGGKWTVRWGTWADNSTEPSFHVACQGITTGNAKSARITTNALNAVLLEWYKNTPYAPLRQAEATFMVPSTDDWGQARWNHLAVFPAYRRPIDGEPVQSPDVRFGRIGADVFHDTANGERLVIQFTSYNDQGCDPDGTGPLPAEGTFGWMPIPGGLQPNHWYRLRAQITQRADSGLDVIGTLQDANQPGFPIIAQTSFSAPPACTPTWYAGSENRWAMGVMGTTTLVDTYLDDFVGWPEQTSPTISAVTATNITSATAKVTWTTHEPSTSRVEYGLTTSYGSLTPLDATLVTSHTVSLSGLATNTAYHYRVRSKDAFGNESLGADKTFTTTAQDVTPPTVSITNPATGANRRRKTTISVTATASDNVGVVRVEFYLDGVLKSTDTSSPYSWSWYTGTTTGQRTLTAKAYDAAGNVKTSAPIVVNVTQ